jgi:hypothetical protein
MNEHDDLDLVDLGDAMVETKERAPGPYPDSEFYPLGGQMA